MITVLTKKEEKEHLRRTIEFCKENSCEMWNHMLLIEELRNERVLGHGTGWIKNRILAEERKHKKSGLDWARLAELKILSTIRANIKSSGRIVKEADFQSGEIEFSMTGELIPVEILEDVISGEYYKYDKPTEVKDVK